MTARDNFDVVLGDWFATSAHEAMPAGLHDGRHAPSQDDATTAGVDGPSRRRSARRSKAAVLIPAIVVMALVGAAVAWGGAFGGVTPTPAITTSPTTSASTSPDATASTQADRMDFFIVPFSYGIPVGSGLRAGRRWSSTSGAIAWVVGERSAPAEPDVWRTSAGFRGQTAGSSWRPPSGPGPTAAAAVYFLRRHPPPASSTIWQARSSADLGPITSGRLRGQRALATSVASYAQNDIHLSGGLGEWSARRRTRSGWVTRAN